MTNTPIEDKPYKWDYPMALPSQQEVDDSVKSARRKASDYGRSVVATFEETPEGEEMKLEWFE